MNLLRFPYSLLLHFFFAVSIILHMLSLYNKDFSCEGQGSHILQLFSYLAGWILLFFPVKGRKFLFPIAVLFPWIEHIRLIIQYYSDPSTRAFWICLLVAVLLPYLAYLLFKNSPAD
jgi:uncharacterized membrane protein HdeD (DUF308 family)